MSDALRHRLNGNGLTARGSQGEIFAVTIVGGPGGAAACVTVGSITAIVDLMPDELDHLSRVAAEQAANTRRCALAETMEEPRVPRREPLHVRPPYRMPSP